MMYTHTRTRVYVYTSVGKRERGLSSRNVYNNVDVTLNDDELRIADFCRGKEIPNFNLIANTPSINGSGNECANMSSSSFIPAL